MVASLAPFGWDGRAVAVLGPVQRCPQQHWDGMGTLWWVVALLGTAPAVSEVAASWVGAFIGAARQVVVGERIPLVLPARWSGSALTPCLQWGRGALCRGAMAAAQPAVVRPAAEPCLPGIPRGSGRGTFVAVRGQRPLSSSDGAISCLWGTTEVRNTPVGPGLASPTPPGELARRRQGNRRKRRRRQRFHPTRVTGFWGKVLTGLCWKLPALPRAAGKAQGCRDPRCTSGWLRGGPGCQSRLGGRQPPGADTGPLARS